MDLIKDIKSHFTDRLSNYLDLHRKMVEINSFTTNPSGVDALGIFTAQEFAKLGFSAEFVQSEHEEYGKHLFLTHACEKQIGQPTIALVSHLDTVAFYPPMEMISNFLFYRKNRIQMGDEGDSRRPYIRSRNRGYQRRHGSYLHDHGSPAKIFAQGIQPGKLDHMLECFRRNPIG